MALQTSPEQPASVRQIVSGIVGWVDRLGAAWIEGQVTQVNRRQGMATVFLTLRDALADVSMTASCQRTIVDSLPTPLVEGARIVVHAKPRVYPNRGSLSLEVREIRLVGEGELLARLERRRQLLAAEGLFADELKRPLPFLPRRVGLVTAPNSAAERDVVENARRRWPGVDLEVKYAAMQGPHCVPEVIEALRGLEADDDLDVIIVARGGGSVEDLLPFSDEALIRVVAALRTPVVSAIGHEPDSPLLDLVADRRASTPTDAAKQVVPDVAEESHRVRQARERIRHQVSALVAAEQQRLTTLRSRPVLADPRSTLVGHAVAVADLRDRSRRRIGHVLDRAADDLDHRLARVRALSPLATMRRGYAVLSDADGRLRTSVTELAAGDSVRVRVADGRLSSTVDAVELIDLPASDHPTATAEETDE